MTDTEATVPTEPDAPADDAEAAGGNAEAAPLDATDLATVEAILFTTDAALSPAKIAEVADLPGGRKAAREAIDSLNERYARMGCSFRIEAQAGGYRMLTLPQYNDVLSRLLKVRSANKLSQSALETLAIVAYRQPILRADVEAIRGVASGEMLRSLMEKSLVKIVGRAEEIGRPMLYGTTTRFLEAFGLASLKDLPKADELALGAEAVQRRKTTEEPAAAPSDAAEAAEGSEQSDGTDAADGSGGPETDSDATS
ncbi:MAG: SMC-Scp complex subunit ScpB [Planctomycetes bacterium]|nr:SMC-Scp complex subunit ScpB [Planctomycetota bacterium]